MTGAPGKSSGSSSALNSPRLQSAMSNGSPAPSDNEGDVGYTSSVGSASTQALGCKCSRSKCLKLYCDCFANGDYCSDNCKCEDCKNHPGAENERQKAISVIRKRSPRAFRLRADGRSIVGKAPRACTCRNSRCLKKYCECFRSGGLCGPQCKCVGCENFQGSTELEKARQRRPSSQSPGPSPASSYSNGDCVRTSPLLLFEKANKTIPAYNATATSSGSESSHNASSDQRASNAPMRGPAYPVPVPHGTAPYAAPNAIRPPMDGRPPLAPPVRGGMAAGSRDAAEVRGTKRKYPFVPISDADTIVDSNTSLFRAAILEHEKASLLSHTIRNEFPEANSPDVSMSPKSRVADVKDELAAGGGSYEPHGTKASGGEGAKEAGSSVASDMATLRKMGVVSPTPNMLLCDEGRDALSPSPVQAQKPQGVPSAAKRVGTTAKPIRAVGAGFSLYARQERVVIDTFLRELRKLTSTTVDL